MDVRYGFSQSIANVRQPGARWWINNSEHKLKVKDDGIKHAKIKGINITVARPQRPRSMSAIGDLQHRADLGRNISAKLVTGVRVEFKTEEERSAFVSLAKRVQEHLVPLPEL